MLSYIKKPLCCSKTLNGCSSTSILTLLICLQYSNDNFERGDISSDLLYEPEKTSDLCTLLSKLFVRYTKLNENVIVGDKSIVFWMITFKSFI